MAITTATLSSLGGASASNTDAWEFFGEMMHSNILEEFYPKLLLHDMGQHLMLPGHRGKTVHIRSWNKANPVQELVTYDRDGVKVDPESTGLDEYSDGGGQAAMSLKDHFGTIRGFGGHFPFTDLHMSISEVAETLSVGARQLGGGYAEVVEDACLKILLDASDGTDPSGGTDATLIPELLGSGGAAWGSVGATDYITVGDIYRIAIEFEANVDGMTYAFPDGNYRGILHPYAKHDLLTNAASASHSLVDWMQTTRGQGMFEGGRIPVLNNVAIETSAFDTTNPWDSHAAFDQATFPTQMAASGFASGVSGYMSLFFAPGAFSTFDLANATPSLILQPFGSGGATGDPLKRAMTIGIKGFQTWIPHQMDRRMKLMATATSLTP